MGAKLKRASFIFIKINIHLRTLAFLSNQLPLCSENLLGIPSSTVQHMAGRYFASCMIFLLANVVIFNFIDVDVSRYLKCLKIKNNMFALTFPIILRSIHCFPYQPGEDLEKVLLNFIRFE